MKKRFVWLAVLMFILAMSVSALADPDVRYVDTDRLKVYEDTDTGSKVLKELGGGEKVLIEAYDGSWVATLCGGDDGQVLGWMKEDQLSYQMPPRYCSHQWSEWTIVQPPGCTSPGYQTRYCTICSHSEDGEIAATGHSFSDWSVTRAATCTAEGVQSRYCSNCGQEESQSIGMIPHSFGDFSVTRQPTCTQAGEKVRRCSMCGLEESQSIDMIPHSFGKWTVTKKPTCTSQGEQVSKCSMCGKEETQTIDKLPHTFSKWKTVKAPTCKAEGEQERKCTVCGYTDSKVLDKLPHSYSKWRVTKKATCTEEGNRYHVCQNCGYKESETLAKLPHQMEEKITLEATDHSSGKKRMICKVCSYAEEEVTFDPEGTIRRGDEGDGVREIQQLLADQNYLNNDGVDGKFGGGTEMALMKFQDEHGFTADGVAWPQTIKKLRHDFGEWEEITPLTRESAGERKRVCKDCGFEQHELIQPYPSMEYGARGDDVRAAQQMLTSLGFDCGADDGIYGQKLDGAYSEFAASIGKSFEPGRVNAFQVDDLVNAWVASIPAEQMKGRGAIDTPVNLALTVTPSMVDESLFWEEEIITYSWNITNMGTEPCVFTFLLLNYGDDPDFASGNIAVVLDGEELLPGAQNSVGGTFKAEKDWGEGNIHFTALGVSEVTGDRWLSNDIVFEKPVPETEAETETENAEAVSAEAGTAEAATEAESGSD